jgi:DNA-binding PadR family transcriptional regulator
VSRDFSPDLDDFREVVREARKQPPESGRSEPGRTSRQRDGDRSPSRQPEVQETRPRGVPAKEARTVLYHRYRGYGLRESEAQTLADLGKFRVIAADDLARFGYNGERGRMEQETANLVRQGLIEEKRVETSLSRTTRMYTLTRTGRGLLAKSGRVPKGQEVYSGFVKPKEAKHDAELYRVYQKEASRIERRGGRVRRVVLDYELKKKVNRDLARLGREKDNPGSKQEVAERYGLRVVHGRIPVPDMQIEYETPEQGIARVNLELTTEDYRPRQLAEKAQAGFTMYSHGDDGARVRRVLNDRDLTAEILSL